MLAIGCDHGGYELKKEILAWLASKNIEYRDFGCHSTEAVNYPVYAKAVAEAVVSGECEKGILVCGTGKPQGSTMMQMYWPWAAVW